MGRIIPYIMENKTHVPNHQPVILILDASTSSWQLSPHSPNPLGSWPSIEKQTVRGSKWLSHPEICGKWIGIIMDHPISAWGFLKSWIKKQDAIDSIRSTYTESWSWQLVAEAQWLRHAAPCDWMFVDDQVMLNINGVMFVGKRVETDIILYQVDDQVMFWIQCLLEEVTFSPVPSHSILFRQ